MPVEESEIKCYRVLRDKDMGWAEVMLNSNGNVTISSDYGTWSYWWNAIGNRTLEQFLYQAGEDYLMSKFGGCAREIDWEARRRFKRTSRGVETWKMVMSGIFPKRICSHALMSYLSCLLSAVMMSYAMTLMDTCSLAWPMKMLSFKYPMLRITPNS